MRRLWSRVMAGRPRAAWPRAKTATPSASAARAWSSSRPSRRRTSSATRPACCWRWTRRRTSTARSSTASSGRWPRPPARRPSTTARPGTTRRCWSGRSQHNLELQRRDGIRRHFAADWQEVAALQSRTTPATSRRERAAPGREPPAVPHAVRAASRSPARAGCSAPRSGRSCTGTHARQHARRSTARPTSPGLDIGGRHGRVRRARRDRPHDRAASSSRRPTRWSRRRASKSSSTSR